MFEIIRKRIEYVKYTLDHRKALQRLAKEKGYSFPFHDLDKVFLYPFLGKHYTQILHRTWSRHHYRNGDIKDKVQAAFDWESARFTKADKPLDAFDTWKKYYADVDMAPTLKMLGLYHEKPSIYVGCPFTFQYADATDELIRSDFRYRIVGEPFIRQTKLDEDIGNVNYTGPFYYYKKGLGPDAVVRSEVDSIRRSDIVLLVFPEDGRAPGTVAELIYAASLGKKVVVFYVPTKTVTEVDSDPANLDSNIHHQYWYPFHQASIINKDVTFHKCVSTDVAKEQCINYVKTLNSKGQK